MKKIKILVIGLIIMGSSIFMNNKNIASKHNNDIVFQKYNVTGLASFNNASYLNCPNNPKVPTISLPTNDSIKNIKGIYGSTGGNTVPFSIDMETGKLSNYFSFSIKNTFMHFNEISVDTHLGVTFETYGIPIQSKYYPYLYFYYRNNAPKNELGMLISPEAKMTQLYGTPSKYLAYSSDVSPNNNTGDFHL